MPTQSVQTQASGNIGATGFATTTSAGSVIAGTNNTAGFTLGVPPFITTYASQTLQPAAAVSIGGNSTSAGAGYSNITSGTAFLLGGNNITLSQNGASITISGASQSVQTQASGNIVGSGFTSTSTAGSTMVGTLNSLGLSLGIPSWVTAAVGGGVGLQVSNTTYAAGTITLQNANGISFGSSGVGGISASYTVPTQSVQTQASGNIAGIGTTTTTQAGSTLGATLSTNGLSLAVPAWITAGGGGGAGYVNLLGANTSGNTTASGSTLGYSGVNLTLSGTNNSQIVISAPATSSLVGVNGITVSSAGSTISISGGGSPYTGSWFEPEVYGGTTTASNAMGTVYFRPFELEEYLSINHIVVPQQVSSISATTASVSGSVSAGNASSGTGSYGLSGTVWLMSQLSTGSVAQSSALVSFFSTNYSLGMGHSISASWSTNVSSATLSYTTSQAISFVSKIDVSGNFTTGSFGTSGSGSGSTTSTNANSFSTSFVASFASQVMSQVRPLLIPAGTSLSPGGYWLAHAQSSATGSTNLSLQRNLFLSSPGIVAYTTNTSGYAEIGSSATIQSSNYRWGIGSYSASSNMTTAIPLSAISAQSNYSHYFNMLCQSK